MATNHRSKHHRTRDGRRSLLAIARRRMLVERLERRELLASDLLLFVPSSPRPSPMPEHVARMQVVALGQSDVAANFAKNASRPHDTAQPHDAARPEFSHRQELNARLGFGGPPTGGRFGSPWSPRGSAHGLAGAETPAAGHDVPESRGLSSIVGRSAGAETPGIGSSVNSAVGKTTVDEGTLGLTKRVSITPQLPLGSRTSVSQDATLVGVEFNLNAKPPSAILIFEVTPPTDTKPSGPRTPAPGQTTPTAGSSVHFDVSSVTADSGAEQDTTVLNAGQSDPAEQSTGMRNDATQAQSLGRGPQSSSAIDHWAAFSKLDFSKSKLQREKIDVSEEEIAELLRANLGELDALAEQTGELQRLGGLLENLAQSSESLDVTRTDAQQYLEQLRELLHQAEPRGSWDGMILLTFDDTDLPTESVDEASLQELARVWSTRMGLSRASGTPLDGNNADGVFANWASETTDGEELSVIRLRPVIATATVFVGATILKLSRDHRRRQIALDARQPL